MSTDLICQCLNLAREQVVARILAGDHDEEALSQSLRISGSCGTCRWKVRKLLAEVAPAQNAESLR